MKIERARAGLSKGGESAREREGGLNVVGDGANSEVVRKIAIVGDLHLAAPLPVDHEEYRYRAKRRSLPADSSFEALCRLLGEVSPDLVVCLGDVVDWYSERNLDYALELLAQFPSPWCMTPGNRDVRGLERAAHGEWTLAAPSPEKEANARQGWAN